MPLVNMRRAKTVVNAELDEEEIFVEDNGPWVANGGIVYSDDFHYDVHLTIHGDFGSTALKHQYAKYIANKLNKG